MMDEKCCGNCKYHRTDANDEYCCFNEMSDYYALETEFTDECIDYEERD